MVEPIDGAVTAVTGASSDVGAAAAGMSSMPETHGDTAVGADELFAPSDDQLAKTPRHRVLARLPGPDDAVAVVEALTKAGIPAAEVFVLCGPAGALRLDPSGRHHGLKGRLIRSVQAVTAYGDEIYDDAAHLAAGGVIISTPARNPDEREVAQRVLRHHGATEMRYFGESTFEEV